jgi:4-aminobutyrate aminotransferase/(S)-3-amino-2-methylpropionate transaminase
MLTGGLYHTAALRPRHAYRVFNTWCGDPSKVILLDAVLKTIARDNLLAGTLAAGEALLAGLRQLEARFPHLLANSRGRGTFCAVDCASPGLRDQVLSSRPLCPRGDERSICRCWGA